MSEQASIHVDMTIEEILSKFPQKAQKIAQELSNMGLSCVGCHAATWETLEAGVMAHGLSEDDLKQLVVRLNNIIQEKQDLTKISITPRAALKYLDILETENKQGWGVRFAEKPGGCNGVEFYLDYSKEPKEDDEVFESEGIEIHIHKDLVSRFLGAELDFLDGLNGSGFKFSNPNVKSSCSCGTSYGY
ncbi:MAG: iron-sulfur cluster assembly accessory protein [Chlamydiales bacterium]|nr:iron-sulfur cluster assembly accessory protein [Chlamydiales bacterium]NCF70746.1 iron-sulfur cluster assembly accessory protein [Chlamydiales bacterium]